MVGGNRVSERFGNLVGECVSKACDDPTERGTSSVRVRVCFNGRSPSFQMASMALAEARGRILQGDDLLK